MTMIENSYLRAIKSPIVVFEIDGSFLRKQNVSLELKLQGKNLAAPRNIEHHIFYHTGDAMTLNKMSHFRVKIKKRVFFEGEPAKTLILNPTKNATMSS